MMAKGEGKDLAQIFMAKRGSKDYVAIKSGTKQETLMNKSYMRYNVDIMMKNKIGTDKDMMTDMLNQ